MPRPRVRSQLAIQAPPELLERLRAAAAARGQTVTRLLLGWIEAGLAAEPSGGDLPDLAASLEELRGDLELCSVRLSRCVNGQAELLGRIGALEKATAQLAAALAQLQASPPPIPRGGHPLDPPAG